MSPDATDALAWPGVRGLLSAGLAASSGMRHVLNGNSGIHQELGESCQMSCKRRVCRSHHVMYECVLYIVCQSVPRGGAAVDCNNIHTTTCSNIGSIELNIVGPGRACIAGGILVYRVGLILVEIVFVLALYYTIVLVFALYCIVSRCIVLQCVVLDCIDYDY